MATEISCIIPDSTDPDARIDGVGGVGWTKDEDTVIAEIEGGAKYYVNVDGREVEVEVAEHDGHKYLKTVADGYTPNNLLSLPTCP
jgi:Protein of unknown function (DUF3892)